MKTCFIVTLIVLALGAGAIAGPDRAPFINNQIRELTKQVDADLASGALTKTDADELKKKIGEVQRIEDSEPSLMPRTRADLREKLSQIQTDLERKEKQAKALASASPTP